MGENGRITVELNRLVIGRPLNFPIHDSKGLLLLAAGSCVTPELKRALFNRGIESVVLNSEDAARLTVSSEIDPVLLRSVRFDERVTEKLDAVVRSGMLNVVNTAPALRDKVCQHGRKPYPAGLESTVVEQQQGAAVAIDQMLRQSLVGEVDGTQLAGIVGRQIESLIGDSSCALSASLFPNPDPSLVEHAVNGSLLAMAIGIEMGLDADNVCRIGSTGLVHDWGMAFVPREIRLSPETLTPVQFLEIQKHPMRTANLLERVRGIPNLVQLVAYQVHERPDGSGYPRGREMMSIHLFARILHVADTYVALTSPRPFRPPMMPYAAMECLLYQAGKSKVDGKVVRALLRVLSLFPIGSLVTLSDGSAARVIRPNGNLFTTPIVVRIQDAAGTALDQHDAANVVDLSKEPVKIVQALPAPGRTEIHLDQDPKGMSREGRDPAPQPVRATLAR